MGAERPTEPPERDDGIQVKESTFIPFERFCLSHKTWIALSRRGNIERAYAILYWIMDRSEAFAIKAKLKGLDGAFEAIGCPVCYAGAERIAEVEAEGL